LRTIPRDEEPMKYFVQGTALIGIDDELNETLISEVVEVAIKHLVSLTNFRDLIVSNFPSVCQNRNTFRNIVLKAFDWENYIYKSLLAVEYISDQVDINEQKKYSEQIINNLDFFNYLIKYSVFRNDKFIVAILRIVKKFNMTNILKAQIKDRPDLGKDERYGRRVIFEFNKDYPVVLAPMMTEENLEEQFFKYLRKYLPNF
jgi:hypothetical protein